MNISIRTPDEIELDALRSEVKMLLELCTERQRANFDRFYPNGIEQMNREKLRNAVGLCQRTIRKTVTGDMYGAISPAVCEGK